jgi:hypothetical protein
VEHPEWDGDHDSDREVGLVTRNAFIARAEQSGETVVASHVSGFGRISGSSWRPVP